MEPVETNEPLVPGEPKGMILTEEAQYFLHESSKWARFLGIMGFIGAGLVAIAGLFVGTIMSVFSRYQQTPIPSALGGLLGFLYIIIAAFAFYVSLKLYQFGSGVKDGIEFKNSEQVSKALGKLKSFFKIKGIILICVLSLYVLIIIGAIIVGIFGASMMNR
jgi:hypothetical protein